jgi:hypothetical protein
MNPNICVAVSKAHDFKQLCAFDFKVKNSKHFALPIKVTLLIAGKTLCPKLLVVRNVSLLCPHEYI